VAEVITTKHSSLQDQEGEANTIPEQSGIFYRHQTGGIANGHNTGIFARTNASNSKDLNKPTIIRFQ
jgi:hypothetical protein